MIPGQTRLELNVAEVAAKVIDGEAIIMNLSNGLYYSMDDVGATIWQLAAEGHHMDAIADMIAQTYDVEHAVAAADLQRLVGELVDERLATVVGVGAVQSAPTPASSERRPYAPPVLHKYSDMADLLALDPPMPIMSPGGARVE